MEKKGYHGIDTLSTEIAEYVDRKVGYVYQFIGA